METTITTPKRAREIMGKNFFGIEEAIKHFGVNPTRWQRAALSRIPFSERVLQKLKNTHILVAVFPLSIRQIRDKVKRKLFFVRDDRYYRDFFAQERGEFNWQLVRKTPVDDSTKKNLQEQRALLGKDNEVPSAQVMVYTIIGHYIATTERLFEKVYVRTSSVSLSGYAVFVGCFVLKGLCVGSYWQDLYDVGVGVASTRKSPQ